jgi:hypothetical protein
LYISISASYLRMIWIWIHGTEPRSLRGRGSSVRGSLTSSRRQGKSGNGKGKGHQWLAG